MIRGLLGFDTVRDRLHMKSIDLAKLDGAQLRQVLLAEVGVMAQNQSSMLRQVSAGMLKEWLVQSSQTLAVRWGQLFQATDP